MKRHFYFAEILLFYAFLAAFNWIFFPHLKGFLDVDPHPYWLGILLFGFRYGVAAGFGSGLLSCFSYLALAWVAGERYRFEDFGFYLLPSFFVFFGVMIGVITSRHRESIRNLKEERGLLENNIVAFRKEVQTLQEINGGLEKKIVTRMSTMVRLYEGARRLESLDKEALYPAILEFTAKTLGAGEAAIYLRGEDHWNLGHTFGWKEHRRRPEKIGLNQGITGLAGNGEKVVSVRDYAQAAKLKGNNLELIGDALMAGPLRIGEGGKTVAVLSIQNIPFVRFDSATVNLFAFLLKWASRSLERAHYVEVLKAEEIIDPEYKIYSKKYFESRLEQEFRRSKMYYLPLSVGLVEVSPLHALDPGQKSVYLLTLSQLLKYSCREMDIVSIFDEPDIPFAFVLVTASQKETETVKEKILKNYAKLKWGEEESRLSLKMGISLFTPKVEEAGALITEARKALCDAKRVETLS